MLKSYDELRKVDVTPYCEKRDGATYLNWAKCVDLLHAHGAEKVYFTPITTESGSSLHMSDVVFTDSKDNTNRCYETKIEVVIDENTYYMQSPVMNGANPVKDNSMSQQRVWNSMCRSFVKCVAINTGLGFDLWLKEEKEHSVPVEDNMYHDITKVRERVFERITYLQKKNGYTLADIAEKINKTEDELKTYLKYYNILHAIENNIFYIK